jgi:hypothetical protein
MEFLLYLPLGPAGSRKPPASLLSCIFTAFASTKSLSAPPGFPVQTVKKLHSCLIAYVGATIGRPPTYRSNAFFRVVCLQGKRARASNARPYKSFSTV